VGDTILTAAQAAERLGVSARTIHRWAADGFFPSAFKLNPAIKNSPLVLPITDIEAFERMRRDYQATLTGTEEPSSR